MILDEVFFDYVSGQMVQTFDRHTAVSRESPALIADLAIPSKQVLNELSSPRSFFSPWWVIGSWVR